MNPKVDAFLAKEKKWQPELSKLRDIALACDLTEELKWGKPCYVVENKNVILIHGFKDYCALLFMKGVLLDDPQNILVAQSANTQAARQIRFTNLQQIEALAPVLREYILRAVEVEKAGLQVDFKETAAYQIPEELQQEFDNNPSLRSAFAALTPGRQRGYLLFFGQAKQAKTRLSRIEKYAPQILEGRGLND